MVHWLFTRRGGRFPLASTNPEGQMEFYDQSTITAHLQCDPGWKARWQRVPGAKFKFSHNTMLHLHGSNVNFRSFESWKSWQRKFSWTQMKTNTMCSLDYKPCYCIQSSHYVPRCTKNIDIVMSIAAERGQNNIMKYIFFFFQAAVDL